MTESGDAAPLAGLPTGLSGHTRLAIVIGDPVRHSLSPAIHNAAFAARGMDWVFLGLRGARRQGARGSGGRGGAGDRGTLGDHAAQGGSRRRRGPTLAHGTPVGRRQLCGTRRRTPGRTQHRRRRLRGCARERGRLVTHRGAVRGVRRGRRRPGGRAGPGRRRGGGGGGREPHAAPRRGGGCSCGGPGTSRRGGRDRSIRPGGQRHAIGDDRPRRRDTSSGSRVIAARSTPGGPGLRARARRPCSQRLEVAA